VLLVLGLAVTLDFSGDSDSETMIVQLQDPSGSVTGTITVNADENLAVLDASGLSPLDEDQTYQMWAISDNAPVGIGVFTPEPDGSVSATMNADLAGVDTIAITIEPDGGSPLPTTEPILSTEL
jgi:anti-sigma-K factor RskA